MDPVTPSVIPTAAISAGCSVAVTITEHTVQPGYEHLAYKVTMTPANGWKLAGVAYEQYWTGLVVDQRTEEHQMSYSRSTLPHSINFTATRYDGDEGWYEENGVNWIKVYFISPGDDRVLCALSGGAVLANYAAPLYNGGENPWPY